MKLSRKFGQGIGDSKLKNRADVAVCHHNAIAVSEYDNHACGEKVYSTRRLPIKVWLLWR